MIYTVHIMIYTKNSNIIERWSMIMTKLNLKKKMASIVAKVGTKQAQNDFNQACVMFIYQPKQPKNLKKYKTL